MKLTILIRVLVILILLQNSASAKKIQSQNDLAPTRPIVVAIIDTGVDIDHPDLKKFLWTNPGESGIDSHGNNKSLNGIDDDKNGYVDDVHGWNFADNNKNIRDDHGHGTHIAGIITANIKTAPLNPTEALSTTVNLASTSTRPSPDTYAKSTFQLMILKYYNKDLSGEQNQAASNKALRYAIKMNAAIINFSGGGSTANTQEFEILKSAEEKNILLVAAAGNESSHSDAHLYFPANYPLENIISVSAVGNHSELLNFSNYGKKNVHLLAPGNEIASTLPGGAYGLMTGTSQATAFVTAAATRLMIERHELQTPQKIKKQLLISGQYNEIYNNIAQSSAVLNAQKSLAMHDSTTDLNGVTIENTFDTNVLDSELLLAKKLSHLQPAP